MISYKSTVFYDFLKNQPKPDVIFRFFATLLSILMIVWDLMQKANPFLRKSILNPLTPKVLLGWNSLILRNMQRSSFLSLLLRLCLPVTKFINRLNWRFGRPFRWNVLLFRFDLLGVYTRKVFLLLLITFQLLYITFAWFTGLKEINLIR